MVSTVPAGRPCRSAARGVRAAAHDEFGAGGSAHVDQMRLAELFDQRDFALRWRLPSCPMHRRGEGQVLGRMPISTGLASCKLCGLHGGDDRGSIGQRERTPSLFDATVAGSKLMVGER